MRANWYFFVLVLAAFSVSGQDYRWNLVEGRAMVNKGGGPGFDDGIYGGLFGYEDSARKLVIPYKYNYAYPFKNGRALTAIKGKFGYINKAGKTIIPHKYGMLRNFINGAAVANIGLTFADAGGHETLLTQGKWGAIDSSGKVIIPIKYDYEFVYQPEGPILVCLKKKWGFIDRNGITLIQFIYDEADEFREGKAKVKMNGSEFFIDAKGQEIKN